MTQNGAISEPIIRVSRSIQGGEPDLIKVSGAYYDDIVLTQEEAECLLIGLTNCLPGPDTL